MYSLMIENFSNICEDHDSTPNNAKNNFVGQVWGHRSLIPTLSKQKQVDLYKFEVILDYISRFTVT